MTNGSQMPSEARVPLAGLLAWLVPGLGHIFIEHKIFKALQAAIYFETEEQLDEFDIDS